MIRFVFRFIGLVALAAAFVLVVYDGARFLANKSLDFITVRLLWESIDQNSFLQFQPAVEQHLTPWVWQSVIQPYFLGQPAALYLFILGAIFILLGRPKKPLIGYSR